MAAPRWHRFQRCAARPSITCFGFDCYRRLASRSVDPYKKLRELLIRERKRAGLSQAALAAKLGKPQSYVSKCEQGERRVDVVELLEIAEALGADPAALVQELFK